MSDTSQPTNDSAPQRDEKGTLTDQTKPLIPPTEEPKAEPKPETKDEPKAEAKGDKPSLINEKDEKAAPEGVPEKYEFTVPDGFVLDEKVATEVTGLFKDLGLNQEGAQRLVDFYTTKVTEAVEAPFQLWADKQQEWQNEIKADPVIGKKLPEVRTTIAKAIDGLGDPALAKSFREAMDYTGAGNNPAFIRAFFKLAQQVTEGKQVTGRGPVEVKPPSERPSTAAHALYPNL